MGMWTGKKATRAERIAIKTEQVQERLHQVGALRADLRLEMRTNGEGFWLAYVNESREVVRTSSAIGNSLRDAEMWLDGFGHAAYSITEDVFMAGTKL